MERQCSKKVKRIKRVSDHYLLIEWRQGLLDFILFTTSCEITLSLGEKVKKLSCKREKWGDFHCWQSMSLLRMYSYLLNGHGLEIEINSKRSLLQSLWNRSRDCGSGELLNGDGTWLEMFFLGVMGHYFPITSWNPAIIQHI